ncbi:MAG: 2-amino-4-hydroxy-6-hydroxymethyldihydropteridine diphosphokinase [Bacteroides sp.]|nr:2-amino-4-hydroxy-6-hydroxymethyldihydropteridine diphosphokinase [Bacteroides sp.]
MRVHINIGSNQGDSHALIGQAVALIASRWPSATVATAGPVESEPWGYRSSCRFLNLALMLDNAPAEPPEAVLDALQAIELAVGGGAPHRTPEGLYCDRPIDIDIIDIDGIELSTPRLTLPHPRAALRPFVIEPLRSLDPATARAIIEAASR